MATGATLCDLCREEDFQPRPLKPADHAEEWDGVSYPSLRLKRPKDVARERYQDLLRAILGPLPARNAQRPTPSEAA